jgi:alpha-D-xyloside xylohydrolase
VEQISMKYLKLRYRLLPYIYSQAVQSTRTGRPMARPMLLEFQDDPTTQHVDLQYMFGDRFLVAPVLTRDGRTKVYLPAGIWVDYWSKEPISGPQWISRVIPLETLPLWVRGGAIIPMGPEMDYVNQKGMDPLTLEFYGFEDSGTITIADEDAPDIVVSYQKTGSKVIIRIGETPGKVELVVYRQKIKAALAQNKSLDVQQTALSSSVMLDGGQGFEVILDLQEGA